MTEKVCIHCKESKDICNFTKTKINKRDNSQAYRSKCKKCFSLTNTTKKNPGKYYKIKELKEKGLRYCNSCNSEQPYFKFGYCRKCTNEKAQEYRKNNHVKENIMLSDKRRYYGYIDEEIKEIWLLENKLKMLPKFTFENIKFYRYLDFGNYLLKKYNISTTRTKRRLRETGNIPEYCLLNTSEYFKIKKQL